MKGAWQPYGPVPAGEVAGKKGGWRKLYLLGSDPFTFHLAPILSFLKSPVFTAHDPTLKSDSSQGRWMDRWMDTWTFQLLG